jgi:hypothetical protein
LFLKELRHILSWRSSTGISSLRNCSTVESFHMPPSNLEFIKHLCRICYVIYHCLRRGTHQLIGPSTWRLISRQLASFRRLSLRLILYPTRLLADGHRVFVQTHSQSVLRSCLSALCAACNKLRRRSVEDSLSLLKTNRRLAKLRAAIRP